MVCVPNAIIDKTVAPRARQAHHGRTRTRPAGGEIGTIPCGRSYLDLDQALVAAIAFYDIKMEVPMSDPADAIMAAIHSAFESFPKEGDPDWRSPSWIMPNECAHLTKAILRELEANGFQIVKKQPNAK